MERRNLPRKARDIKRNHSEEINFESPKVKKKHSKKQYDKTTEKNLEDMEFSKRNGNKEENDDKTPLNNSYDKTPTITKLMATEENVSLNIKESSKRTKLNDNKNTDAPVTKKKLPSKDKVKVPLKQNVEISANIKTVSLSKGEDAAPLKVLKFQTPVNDVPALKKKKLSSKVKNEKCVPKESVDDDKNNDIPFSKSKNVTSKKKKEIAAKKNKKPSKVVIDSGILATKNKKMPSKELDKLVTNEKGIQKLQNSVETNYANIDFNINELYNTKICSFNVAGIRAFVKKGGHEYFEKERPDIICLQELKCGTQEELPKEILIKGYHAYWNLQKGHNGVGILSKKLPISFTNGIGDEKLDEESRMVTLEYEKFFIICVYAVNAGRGLTTMDKKMKWNSMFDKYVQGLDKQKSVIIAGDLNCAYEDIDLANPKTNKKSAGFTPEERQGFSNLLSLGFVDTFREFYPKKEGAYTFWTYMGSARSKNIGWRLDYFLVSKRFMTAIKDNVIRSEILGSDHCPIVLFMIL